MATTEQIIEQRGQTYGSFRDNSEVTQALMSTVLSAYQAFNPDRPIPPYMMTGLSMIFQKMSRAVVGDPYYVDNWRDISAYAKLIADELMKEEGATDAVVIKTINTKDGWQRQEGK